MPIDKKLFQKAKRLKVIAMPAMGIDHIDSDFCKIITFNYLVFQTLKNLCLVFINC